MKSNVRSPRIALIVITALFLLPLVIAWLMNFSFEGWRPAGRSNHGQLVEPPRPVASPAHRMTGSALDEDYLNGKWTLLYIAGERCDETCRGNLYKMRQVRLAQGKEIHRIQRLMVIVGPSPSPEQLEAKQHYPGLELVTLPAEQRSQWLSLFAVRQDDDVIGSGRVYLIDPLGNLMMWYGPDAEPRGMLEDLERLLRISHVG